MYGNIPISFLRSFIMELHIIDLSSAPLGVLFNTVFFTTLATIATFVCLKSVQRSRKLAGFFSAVTVFILTNVLIFIGAEGIFPKLLPALGLYPIVGFLASVSLGMLCLSIISVICGSGALKRSGKVLNTIFSFVCFIINAYFTYSAWDFARYTYESELFRYDAGRIDIKDALPFLKNASLPEALLDSGIEIPVIAVLIIFLAVYFISITVLKSQTLHLSADEDDDSLNRCCAYCEHAECIENCRTKMLCRHKGTVASSGSCRRFVYDPLKRKAFRPQIARLDTSDFDTDDII